MAVSCHHGERLLQMENNRNIPQIKMTTFPKIKLLRKLFSASNRRPIELCWQIRFLISIYKMVDARRVTTRSLDLFETLCNRIACLVYSRTDGDKKALNQILEALNSLDYNLFCVKKERGLLLINQCCYIIPAEETCLASKAVNLFTKLLTKGQITVEGKTLSLAVCWCLECMKHGNQITTLKCLQELVKGNGKKVEQDCHNFLTELEKLSDKFTFGLGENDICLNCLRCAEAITFLRGSSEKLPPEIALKYFEIFKEVLFKEKSTCAVNEIIFCKYLITAMRGIENLIQNSDEILNSELGNILGIVKGYMLYGLPDYDNYKVQKIFPSSATIPEVFKSFSPSVRKLRGKYDKRPKKVAVTSITTVEEAEDTDATNNCLEYSGIGPTDSMLFYKTSDSDFSDSEFGQDLRIKSYEGKVRHCALILMGTVIHKIDPKVFIAYLSSFLPDGSKFNVRTLITCLLKDPLAKCRCEVLGVLLTIISNSRQYFLQAEGISKSSFIAFSCTISNLIKELHRALILNLVSEDNSTAIKRCLKCISDLIRCSPYHKMEPGLITSLANHVRGFLKHKDVNFQIFALIVFGCIVSVEPKVKELRDIIIMPKKEFANCEVPGGDEDFVKDFEFFEESDTDIVQEKPWLFELCLQNLKGKPRPCDSSTNAALQVESLRVIGALVQNFFSETLASFPNEIIELLQCCSDKLEYAIRLSSGKLMETVLNSLQFSFCQEDQSKTATAQLVSLVWEALLPGPITKLIQSAEEPMLRCTGCDCIANVGVQVQNGQLTTVQSSLIFDQLSRNKQITCISLLFGCIKDESPAVRSSASRAVAFFVMFPCLREDSLFFLDVIDAALALFKDENAAVRTQASWLLGNLSEAIVLNKRENIDDGLSLDILAKLLKSGITLAADNPKVIPGAVRGVGNFLQVANEEFMKKYKDLVLEGIEALIKNATTGSFMKARWNSCYAIANLLQNPLIRSNNEWMTKIFHVMTSLVQHYKNFKVRISAGFVLGVPPTRECYGDLYDFVWSAVLNALENSKNISDFNEYQHRDQLVDQLCLLICHLISLMNPNDVNSLQDVLYFHLDNLNHFMGKFKERIIPEKSGVLLNATEKINFLMQQKCLTVEEKSVIRTLNNFFVREY